MALAAGSETTRGTHGLLPWAAREYPTSPAESTSGTPTLAAIPVPVITER